MRSEILEAKGADGGILRVEFLWRGDRFGHAISIVNPGGEAELLLESLEGTSADDWPASPPLQSLHREALADSRTALLLVGSAGRSHWSASVEASASEPGLLFDLACRPGTPPGWLGCRYRTHAPATAAVFIESDNAVIQWEASEVRIPPRAIQLPTVRWKYSIGSRCSDSTKY